MKKFHLAAILIALSSAVFAQTGEITGKIIDEKGEGAPFANVAIVEDGVPTGFGTTTDFDGNFSIKPLNPGSYDVKVSYLGYKSRLNHGVIVSADKITFLDLTLEPTEQLLEEVIVESDYEVPLIDAGQTSTQNTLLHDEIEALPTKNIQSMASTTAGVYQSDEDDAINIKGGRSEATEYYIDGIKVRGSTALPSSAIEQINVVTGGVPARYGDATGGIVSITTRSAKRKWEGQVELETSEVLDNFGYTLGAVNVTGPLMKAKGADGKRSGRTILGLFLSGEYVYEKDPNPSAVGVWVANDDVLRSLEEQPLRWNSNETALIKNSETITFDDIENRKFKPNAERQRTSGVLRFDFRPTENVSLAVGGNAIYQRSHPWVERYTLLNSGNNPLDKIQTYRAYVRFTHNLGKRAFNAEEAEQNQSAIQNAYYTIQADYQKNSSTRGDEVHGDRLFDYGYIGKFETQRSMSFGTLNVNNFFQVDETQFRSGYIHNAFSDDLVEFTPGDINPFGANYTTQYYDLIGPGAQPGFNQQLIQIEGNGALINGQRSTLVHDVWFNTGREFNQYRVQDNDQFAVKVEGAFDILKAGSPGRNKHSIEFGLSFEQRVDRVWNTSPLNLWGRMRDLVNDHIENLDLENPILHIDGQEYAWDDPTRPIFGSVDTIVFNRLYEPGNQRSFDRRLREKLGLAVDGLDFIDVDALDLEMFDIGLFTPDELWLDGAQLVVYYGYDHKGNKLKGQPSFNDFFSRKDDNGDLTRLIPAFRPIYTAAYIQDKFQFRDLTFNVGLRVDRFDANQKVLKDPYSLYEIRSVAEVPEETHPGTIGEDYAVYVNDYTSDNPIIVGYRDGDDWYDREGNLLANGTLIESAGSGGSISPYLVNTNYRANQIKNTDGTYDPNATFEDYNPQITVMPRLQFSFNLTEQALFFAHYDVLSQRPQSRLLSTPDDWLFFTDAIGTVFNNPALKPEKTIDFQVGFKQKLSRTSAVTIAGFYREFKDMVQVVAINSAYPNDYLTFGNVDFGTAKGFNATFDLRRTGNIRLSANYSIQFALGTGSNDASQFSVVNSQQPNLRTIAPLNFDARHTMNITFDYRYGKGKDYNGPVIKNSQILSNAGVNMTFTARSGTPYTQQREATPEGITGAAGRTITEGSLNGSRLPWTFRLNMKINKEFHIKMKDKADGTARKPLFLDLYFQFQNLLNRENVVSVFRFTGDPDDDGYLSSEVGVQDIESRDDLSKASFQDLYQAYINRPDHYSQPRTIRFGLIAGF